MIEIDSQGKWQSLLVVVPAFPDWNIFSGHAKIMTALGPIMVATSANKVWGWNSSVVDENNYRGPRGKDGLPDHCVLQKQNPVKVVGLYCGLSSTMNRAFEVAKIYHQQGVITIAGGWHAHYCPEEMLRNNIDIVVHGDGEGAIQQILQAISRAESFENIPGISFMKDGKMVTNGPEMLELPCLNSLPFPDFGLLRYAHQIKIYPVGRIRGCRMKCEFCSVKGAPRWAGARHLFETVNHLVETRGARSFFIVDDRLEGDLQGTMEFFQLIAERYGKRLHFTVQIRLEAARNTALLSLMKQAGVRYVCIGYESPIDADLKEMKKGYLSKDMLAWTKIYRSFGFRIHGMFIFGYPPSPGRKSATVAEMVKCFKHFIKKARFFTIQIMHPVPLVGTELRERLVAEGRVFPLEIVPWSRYDANSACFIPDNMTLQEFQETPTKLMRWFYSFSSFFRIPLKTLAFPVDFLIRGWERWRDYWWHDIFKYGGHLILQRWRKRQKKDKFLEALESWIRDQKNKDLT